MIRNSKTGRCCSCTDNLYKEGILEMTKVFIDGSYGTTGLRIHQRLQSRTDLELISIPYEERHSESARRKDGSTVFRKSAVPKLLKRHP